jgi:hypothetical protein
MASDARRIDLGDLGQDLISVVGQGKATEQDCHWSVTQVERAWLPPPPSTRINTLRPGIPGSWFSACLVAIVLELELGFPGRNMMGNSSPVPARGRRTRTTDDSHTHV